jgi:hypothetical protein
MQAQSIVLSSAFKLIIDLLLISFYLTMPTTSTTSSLLCLVAVILALAHVSPTCSAPIKCQDGCRWAATFSAEQLLNNATARAHFIKTVMYWEGQFHQNNVGITMPSALTLDGHRLEVLTGMLQQQQLDAINQSLNQSALRTWKHIVC